MLGSRRPRRRDRARPRDPVSRSPCRRAVHRRRSAPVRLIAPRLPCCTSSAYSPRPAPPGSSVTLLGSASTTSRASRSSRERLPGLRRRSRRPAAIPWHPRGIHERDRQPGASARPGPLDDSVTRWSADVGQVSRSDRLTELAQGLFERLAGLPDAAGHCSCSARLAVPASALQPVRRQKQSPGPSGWHVSPGTDVVALHTSRCGPVSLCYPDGNLGTAVEAELAQNILNMTFGGALSDH
jgi:hypothetical protein